MLSALSHREFRFLLSSDLATHIGHWVQQIAKGWLVYELTESPLQLSLVAIFSNISMLIWSPIGGALADRIERRTLLIGSQLLMMGLALMVAFLVLTDAIEVWHIYIAAAMNGAFFAINTPARQSMSYDIVGREHLANAVALTSLGSSSMRVVGPSLGGVLLATVDVEGAFFMQAVAAMTAMALAAMIHGRFRPSGGRERVSFRESLLTGLRYARTDRTIAMLLIFGLIAAVLAWPYIALMPAYTSEVLGLGATGFGFAMAATGAGAMVAALVIAATNLPRKGIILIVAQFGSGILLMLLAVTSIIPAGMAILVLLGTATTAQSALNQTMLQMNVQDEYRGRVLSLLMLTFGLQPLGLLPVGAMSERYGIEVGIFILGAVLASLVAAVSLFAGRVRRL